MDGFDTTHIPTITIHNSTDSKIINSVEERLNSKENPAKENVMKLQLII